MFSDEIDVNHYVYHYTNYSTALEYILPSQTIRFNPYKNTNDPKESKDWFFSMSYSNQDRAAEDSMHHFFSEVGRRFNDLLKSNAKLICFTTDKAIASNGNKHLRGFEHPRMWAQYAGNHKGICLMFNKIKLNQLIEDKLNSIGEIFNGDVSYEEGYNPDTFNINFADANKNMEESVKKHVLKHSRGLFFSKFHDWKDECEFRWVLLSSLKNEYEYLNYEDSLEAIIIGADFPKIYEPIIEAYCEKFKINAAKMFWMNGMPYIHPGYEAETGESYLNKAFSENPNSRFVKGENN